MNLRFNASAIIVKDIETSKQFYKNLLGLEAEHDFGKNVSFLGGLAIWELRAEHIVPQTLNSKLLKHGNRFELYFETTDIAKSHATLVENKVAFLHEIHEEPWGGNIH